MLQLWQMTLSCGQHDPCTETVLSGLTALACAQTTFKLFGSVAPTHSHQLFGWHHPAGTSFSTTFCPSGKGSLYPAPLPQPFLLTHWAAPAYAPRASDFLISCPAPAFTALGCFPLCALWPDPYFNTKRISRSHHHNWHSSPPSAHNPFSSVPYDSRCLSFIHLTDLFPFSLVLDLQAQADIFLHPPSLGP